MTRISDTPLVSGFKPLTAPNILLPESADRAVLLLRRYTGALDTPAYSGASFLTIGRAWSHPADVDDVTPADLVALATLSVAVSGSAAIEMLDRQGTMLARLLRDVPADIDLVDADDEMIGAGSTLEKLWTAIRAVGGMGPTRTSKLLARKRPRLVPIYDSVIARQFGLPDSRGFWNRLRESLRAEGGALHAHALELREKAGLAPEISALRVIDIVVWMDGVAGQPSDGRLDEE